jgi:hypothetical protein
MHYEDFDRRLDEWVAADRLGDEVTKHRSKHEEVASVEGSQKMTRTQKRRFDEIHTTMPGTNSQKSSIISSDFLFL